jgi:hypothetical protein
MAVKSRDHLVIQHGPFRFSKQTGSFLMVTALMMTDIHLCPLGIRHLKRVDFKPHLPFGNALCKIKSAEYGLRVFTRNHPN